MSDSLVKTLARREKYRDTYTRHRDPIAVDRMLWRAQAFRHLVHLVPGQTILELGCGNGQLTQALVKVSRGENPITAVTFLDETQPAEENPGVVQRLHVESLPGPLLNRQFDLIVAQDLLDSQQHAAFLIHVYDLLTPGGQVVFYESNPWNVVLRMRRGISRISRKQDPRGLLSRTALYEVFSEVGFVRVFAAYNDFVYAPLTRRLAWVLRNVSIVLENMPAVQTLAGSILVHAQKPPRIVARTAGNLPTHEVLRGQISFVVPCHNEEMNVRPLVEQIRNLYEPYVHEILLVDDNSSDRTADAIKALEREDGRVKGVYRKPPNGVGRALTDGYHASTGNWVLSMDCDFVHLMPELRDLFDAAANGSDVVIGSRFSRHSVLLNYPIQKILGNRAFHLLARIVLNRRLRDVTNNLKLIRREILEKIELQEPGFAANAETGLYPMLLGCKIQEVPISWINRTPEMGKSTFKLSSVGPGYYRVLSRVARARFSRSRTI